MSEVPLQGLELRAGYAPLPTLARPGSGFRVQGSGFRVQGSGFRVQGSRCGVWGSGCRVWTKVCGVRQTCGHKFTRMFMQAVGACGSTYKPCPVQPHRALYRPTVGS